MRQKVALFFVLIATLASAQSVTVYITRTGEKYHLGFCRHLSQSKIKTTLKEAKAKGYAPCKVCKPPR